MKSLALIAIMAALLAPILVNGQLPPQTIPAPKPSLRRDSTPRVLAPRIIQSEDERIVSDELMRMVNLSSGGVRRRAILALGRIGSPAGVAPLVDRLTNDRNPAMRALAAFSLGEIESHYSTPELLTRLDVALESSAEVRARAVEALGKIVTNRISADALGKFGQGTIRDSIVRMLPDPSKPVTEDSKLVASMAITALLRIREPSTVNAVAAQLRSQSPDLRWQAANALARMREGIAAAVPLLLPLLGDKDPLVRAHAARALAVAGDKVAVDPMLPLLSDSDERVVAVVISALGTLGDGKAVVPLVNLGNRLLTAYSAFDRTKEGVPPQQNTLLLISTSLGNLKDERGLVFLRFFRAAHKRIGSSPEVEVAIAKFGEAAFFEVPEDTSLAQNDWTAVAAYAQGLGELRTERARKLLHELLSGPSGVRPDPRAVPSILNAMKAANVDGLKTILLEQLKAQDVIVRTTAAELLGQLGDSSEDVVNAMAEAYKVARPDKMNDARLAILDAADKLKRPLNIQALADPTRDEDYIVRRRAFELLRQSNEEALSVKLHVGKVETGHDRAYWRRVARLSEDRKTPPVAILHTKKGRIRIELFASDAPMTVDNFIQLSKRKFYDGLTFMRVVPNFVIQGGDPRNDMNGGPGYQIRCEINQRPYITGSVGMALSGKDTGGSQFFITHSPQPHLDGGYTVFGQVVGGMDVVNRMARGDVIERVEIVE